MIKNNWINPMHTNVPGTDGKMSYGGYCFPKDTNVLECMKWNNSRHKILEASIHERNEMRDDNEKYTTCYERDTLIMCFIILICIFSILNHNHHDYE